MRKISSCHLATALQTEDGPVEAEGFYGLTGEWRAPLLIYRSRLRPSNARNGCSRRAMRAH